MTNAKALGFSCKVYDDVSEFVRENMPEVKDIDEYINKCSRRRLLDMYLSWNGIIDYTDSIISVISLLFPDNEIREVDFDTKCDGTF